MGTNTLAKSIRKIPGFRSGTRWKAIVAGIFYFFIFLIFIAFILPSAPSLALENLAPTNKSSVTIKGETYSGKPVFLLQEGKTVQTAKADSGGKFLFALNDLEEGNFTYTVQSCNSEKREKCKTENVLVQIDKTPPSMPVIAIPDELPDDEEEKVIIAGSAGPSSKIIAIVTSGKLEAYSDEKGEFQVATNLVVGANTIDIKAVDDAGNESELASSEIDFNPKKYWAKIVRAIDGDTVETEDGQRIRYIGIDTPETSYSECYAQEALNKNKELVEGKEVKLEKDVSETDRYGRLLRYVWVDNMLVNEYLVKEGYAQVSTYPPDVKYQERFLQAQEEAREKNKGLWGDVCKTPSVKSAESPAARTQPESAQDTGSGGYICNCAKTCGQMLSCQEAYFQLNDCGCSARDGDKDGVPCESICLGGESAGVETPAPQPQPQPSDNGSYSCDCSKTCSQMSSCDEAYYQLNQCGCSVRDGDKDGVPCENICPGG